MNILSLLAIARTALLTLAGGWGMGQPSLSDSTPQSTRERKPVAQEVIPPINSSETSVQESGDGGPQPIEAPAPGVPEGRRTYREIKERAKGGR